MASRVLDRIELEDLLKKEHSSIVLQKASVVDRPAECWSQFSLIVVAGIMQDYVLCDICRKIIKYKPTTGTGGLKKHMKGCQKDKSSGTMVQSTINTFCLNKYPPKSLEKLKKEMIGACIEFVALDSRPFEAISNVGLTRLLETVFAAGKSTSQSRSIQISDLIPHPTTVRSSFVIRHQHFIHLLL